MEVLRRKVIEKGDPGSFSRFFGTTETIVSLPGNGQAIYRGLIVGDTAHVVPVTDDLDVLLVRQQRPNAMREGLEIVNTLELPGGFVEPEEGAYDAAVRQLREEAGVGAGQLEKLTSSLVCPGATDEIDHLFLGTGLVEDRGLIQNRSATEHEIEVVALSFGALFDSLRTNEYNLAMQTMAGILVAHKVISG